MTTDNQDTRQGVRYENRQFNTNGGNMEERQFDDNLKGALWAETQSEVTNRGHIMINGEKHYCVVVKSQNKEGKTKYELMVSAGLVHEKNEKSTDRSPDLGGNVTVAGNRYRFGGWSNETNAGLNYLSCSLRENVDAPF
tara:strand:+ start:71 stop:487 length:417 start_codon:yes stop_codon:yes gene_type:complete